MKHLRNLALGAIALMGAATAASAQEAYTTNDVAMRAGPGTRYPVVRMVPEDAVVYIHGCLRNWDWCDVSWRRSRGWVFSDYLEGLYRNRRIGFDEWRDYVDLPYVSFSFGYWDRYYRDRPWYGHWERWGDRNDRYWRERHRNGDWNDSEYGNGGTRSRTDTNGDGYGDNERNRRRDPRTDDNTNDDGGMQCAPDDPRCNTGGNGRRWHRDNGQMDQPQ